MTSSLFYTLSLLFIAGFIGRGCVRHDDLLTVLSMGQVCRQEISTTRGDNCTGSKQASADEFVVETLQEPYLWKNPTERLHRTKRQGVWLEYSPTRLSQSKILHPRQFPKWSRPSSVPQCHEQSSKRLKRTVVNDWPILDS